jgi:hypothetical protein
VELHTLVSFNSVRVGLVITLVQQNVVVLLSVKVKPYATASTATMPIIAMPTIVKSELDIAPRHDFLNRVFTCTLFPLSLRY